MSISVRLRWALVAAFVVGTLVLANPFPPLWGNGAGAAVHFRPVAWPNEPLNSANCGANCGDWKPYTRFRNPIGDPRTQDPSNGGTAPQSYVNVASSCTDKNAPSVYYYLHRGATPADDVIMFRWRVESAAHNYATGPSPGNYGASSPWSSAQWTVFFDVGGSGYRTFAAHLNGSSGSPAEPVDMLVGIWSNTPNQSIDYSDPNVHVLGHNPTAFVGPSNRLMNFHGTLSPDESWPNGAAETQWDYGTTRAKRVSSSPCDEYFVDYQIPVAMLDASSLGGPTITRDTPISMLFCTANSLTNPFQKDCAINRQWTADATRPAPFGDYLSFNRTEPYQQPIVSAVSATPPASCPGNYTLNATVQDTLAVQSGVVTNTLKSVKFFYWYDRNGDGLATAADTGSEWISASTATLKSGTLNAWQASWAAGGLAKGKYLIGVQAVDDNTMVDDGAMPTGIDNRTFSYLPGDTANEIYIGNTWKTGQQASFPAHSPVQVPGGTENWYGNPSVTGLQVALVGTAINACGVAPTIALNSTPASVAVGGTVSYTVTLANPGSNSQAETFSSVTATLPTGFSYVNASTSGTNGLPSTNPVIASQTLTWTMGAPLSLSPGQSATLAFDATASSTPGVYSVTANSASSFGTLTSSPASTTVDSARLSLSMTPGAYSIAADGATSLTYTLRYANDSGVGVTAASITSVLPTHVNYVGCSGGSICSNAAGTVTWTLGSISANSSGTVTLTVNVANTMTAFSLSNSATLSATPPGGGTVSANASATVAVTGVAVSGSAAFTLVKTASAATMAPGGPITYTLSYNNYGSAGGSSVTITDTLPSGMSFSSCTGSCSQGSGTVTWNIGSVAAGASGAVTVTVTAATPFTASNPATNSATLTWSGGTPVNASVSTGITGQACSVYYYRNATANVGFAGTQRIANISPVPVSGDTGSSVTVTAPVSGSAYLEAVRFYQDPATSNDVPFDGNITSNVYIDRANGQGLNVQATVYDYNSTTGGTTQLAQQNTLFNGSTKGLLSTTITPSGTLANGHRLLWVYEVRSNHNSQTVQVQFQFGGTVTNAVSGGTTFANSNASYCVTPPANLTLSNRVSAASIVEATTPTLKYTLGYANAGSANALNATLVARLPTGFTACEYSTNDSTWANCSSLGSSPQFHTFSLGTVAGGASGTVYVRGAVPGGTTAGNVLTATSTIDSDQTVAINASATTNVAAAGSVATPALAVNLSADRTTVAPGGAVVYTATVVNTGSGTANNVVVSNALPISAYYTYGGCSGSCGVVAGTATWPAIASLAPGASQSFTYTMNVGTSGLPAGVTLLNDNLGATGDSSLSATSNTVTVAVNGNPSLGLLNNVSPTVGVRPGTELTYTITLSNGGAANAGDVLVANPIPANTDYSGNLSATQGSASFDAVNNRVLFDVGTLNSGSSTTLSFRAVVRSPLASGNTLISSTATATSSNAVQQQHTANVTAAAAANLTLMQTAPTSVAYPSATLSAAASGTLLLVDRTDRLQVNQLLQVNGQVARVLSMTARTITVDSTINAAGGAPVVGAVPVTLTYANDGDADATGVTVRESLHNAFGFYSATPAATSSPILGNGGDVDWNVGTLATGASASVEVQTFPSGASGSFLNLGSISAANATTANASTVTAVGGLTFAKSTTSATVSAGSIASYTIVASNSLGSSVSPVSITDSLPSGFSYRSNTATVGGVSIEPTFDAADIGSTQPTWSGLTIPAGGTLVIVFQADVAAATGAGTYNNEVAVSAPAGAGVMVFDPLLSSAEDVTVLAAASGVLKGYVFQRASGNSLSFDPANDTPLAGVRVQIHKAGADCANPVGNNCFVVDTDSNGYFERVVPAEGWIVSVVPATGALPGGWFQIAGANDDTVNVPDQGSVIDYNGFSSSAPPSHLVSTSAGANGSLSPASRTIVDGATTTFTVTPDSGYLVSSVSGCSGSLAGSTYTTGAITGACTVTASFVSVSVPTHNVTAVAASGGAISPSNAVVADGSTTSFTVTPDLGQQIAAVTGCSGNLSGNTYTTGAITAACTVNASFTPVMINVTASSGANGSISPPNASVAYGATTSFTVTPDSGFDIASVAGCGGSLAGNTYTTGVITGACAVSATFIAQGVPSFLVSSVASSGGSVSPGSVLVASGATTSLAITPDTGYSIASASGCGGSLSGSTYTTGAIGGACTVNVSFSANSHQVSASAGSGGSVSPPSQSVTHGATTSIAVTPDAGYGIDTVTGCGGSLSGNTYTTAAITTACAVTATFNTNSYTVTSSAGTGGAISPPSQSVSHGATTSFTVTPATGYSIDSVSGCGGSLSGNTFTTGLVTGACSVNATFSANSYTVTSSAGTGGSITPPSQSVTHGSSTSFTLTPDVGYSIDTVSGCGGSLSGNTYTTGAITGACAVTASFSNNKHAVTAVAGAGGTVSPTSQLVTHGGASTITVTPDTGYTIDTVSGCGGSLSGNTFTTGTITSACSVNASFRVNSYTVTASAGQGGAIAPPTRSVAHGATTTFSITPEAGYATASVIGCGGTLSGITYTTAAITGACSINATFSPLGPSFGPAPPARINARSLTADVPSNIAPTATDANGNPLVVTLVGGSRLRPGRHTLTWRAVDGQGREITTQQQFDVWPMVSAGNDLTVGFGSSTAFNFVLNGDAPEYPFTVSFTVTGPGLGSLHNLESGMATFTSGTEAWVSFNALPQGTSMPVQHLAVALDPAANLSARASLDIALISANEAPRASIVTTQATRIGDLVAQDGGSVSLRVDIEDPNPADTHVVAWSVPAGLAVQTSSDGRMITFDPMRVNAGVSKFDVQVTDSGTPRLTAKTSRRVAVRAASLVLGAGDANGNAISDADEGWGDSGNGIPAYLSRDSSRQVLPEDAPVTDRYLVEGTPDQALRVGVYALLNGGNGARIDTETVYSMTARDVVANVGGIFSVDASSLGSRNAAIMVIPQRAAIPANAVYRLWDAKNNRWMSFVENGANQLASAPGTPGYCPPAGSSAYQPGLKPGGLCVQVAIEDGGPNDGDAQKDGAMTSLGGIAQRVDSVVTGSSQGGSGGGGAMGIEVLMLAMLLVWRALRRSRAWLAPLLAVPLAVNAAEPEQERWYAGLSVVSVHNSDGAAQMDRRLAAEGYETSTSLSGQDRFGGSVFAGYELGRFALELGYVTLGRMDTRINGNEPVDDAYLEAISRAHPRSGVGPQGSVLATLPLNERVELFGRAGLFYWKNLQIARSGGQAVRGTDRRLDPMVAFGLSVKPRTRWSIRAGIDIYRLDGETVTGLQLGLLRSFNGE